MAKKEPKILTKKILADEIAEKQGLTKKAAAELVNYVFDEAAKTLKKGGVVNINGFGKFSIKKRAARTGINPRTKETIKIKATKVPTFKASKTLKDLVK
jgi:DNA-binding protein HU-beta